MLQEMHDAVRSCPLYRQSHHLQACYELLQIPQECQAYEILHDDHRKHFGYLNRDELHRLHDMLQHIQVP